MLLAIVICGLSVARKHFQSLLRVTGIRKETISSRLHGVTFWRTVVLLGYLG